MTMQALRALREGRVSRNRARARRRGRGSVAHAARTETTQSGFVKFPPSRNGSEQAPPRPAKADPADYHLRCRLISDSRTRSPSRCRGLANDHAARDAHARAVDGVPARDRSARHAGRGERARRRPRCGATVTRFRRNRRHSRSPTSLQGCVRAAGGAAAKADRIRGRDRPSGARRVPPAREARGPRGPSSYVEPARRPASDSANGARPAGDESCAARSGDPSARQPEPHRAHVRRPRETLRAGDAEGTRARSGCASVTTVAE